MFPEKRKDNLKIANFRGVGKYNIPKISPIEINFNEFISFNYALTCRNPQDKGIHYFIDDYQFIRLWNDPQRYLHIISKFSCTLSPDFSLYTDYPRAMMIYNHFRKHWLGEYWQKNSIRVIPTISWAEPDSYEWCFDGEPTQSTVAVSSVGTQKNKRAKELFIMGYNEMLNRLNPNKILFFGPVPKEAKGNIIHIPTFYEKFDKKEGA